MVELFHINIAGEEIHRRHHHKEEQENLQSVGEQVAGELLPLRGEPRHGKQLFNQLAEIAVVVPGVKPRFKTDGRIHFINRFLSEPGGKGRPLAGNHLLFQYSMSVKGG